MGLANRVGGPILAAAIALGCSGGATPADGGHQLATPAATGGAESGPDRGAASDARTGSKPAEPEWREVTVPAGTSLPLILETSVASDTSRVEDPVRARVSRAIVVEGVTAIPEGSSVAGVVTAAERAGKVKGTSRLSVRFDSLTLGNSDERYAIDTSAIARSGPTQKKKDALEIAAPAAGGAIIGGIVGGKKGAAIGGAAGGGAGTAIVLTQRGQDVRLARGAAVTVRLTEPLTVRVRS